MGKIRVKTLGIEDVEKQEKKEVKKRQEKKSASQRTAKVPGLKGGERLVAVGPSEEELGKLDSSVIASTFDKLSVNSAKQSDKKEKFKKTTQRSRSKNYKMVAKMVDKTKTHTLSVALELLSKLKRAKFDETVELHINTVQAGISATTTLPYGTGKKIRVVIANDEIIENVERGKIDFDVLLAEPSIMPKLAKVAKFLGPRGLMPNPKSGTISNNPKELAKKYEGGQVTLKTEAKAPIMHLSVGKLSFGEKKLIDNIQTVLDAVKPQNIKNITLKSTMSPGIRIQLDQLA